MALLIRTHFRLAKTSIKENRTRSFLTCLGIAIGVASIILILIRILLPVSSKNSRPLIHSNNPASLFRMFLQFLT